MRNLNYRQHWVETGDGASKQRVLVRGEWRDTGVQKRRADTHARPRARPGQIDAELAKAIAGGDECIHWPFSISADGYGVIGPKLVHRIVCERAHGRPPADRFMALHTCGNRACCNSKHLRWGDGKENIADMVRHGNAYNW